MKKTTQKKTTRTRTRKRAPLKDPKGGLTAAGRKAFAKKDGAHLKPGVRKTTAEMTPTEMRRKGSWAVRFYGRTGALPPLIGENGKPTRFALTAAAWGEPVPRTGHRRPPHRGQGASAAGTREEGRGALTPDVRAPWLTRRAASAADRSSPRGARARGWRRRR